MQVSSRIIIFCLAVESINWESCHYDLLRIKSFDFRISISDFTSNCCKNPPYVCHHLTQVSFLFIQTDLKAVEAQIQLMLIKNIIKTLKNLVISQLTNFINMCISSSYFQMFSNLPKLYKYLRKVFCGSIPLLSPSLFSLMIWTNF